jgi:channel protein (hemolysin III family)
MSSFPTPFLGFADPVSSWSHLLAAFASVIGGFVLCYRGRGNPARVASLIVFSLALVFLFSMSGVFHLLPRDGQARGVLQRLDHAGIWVLIAGTFTPMHTILFRGSWRWLVLTLVWTLAITGLVLEVVFFSSFPEWLLLSFFLGLGWIGALSGVKFERMFKDSSVKLLLAGGLFYSIGAVIDFVRWPTFLAGVIGPHEIFHFFVILGALSHWLFIYRWSSHPVANKILFNVQICPTRKVIATAVGESLQLEADSVDEIKRLIKARVTEKYHATIQPTIRLRYFQEEQL